MALLNHFQKFALKNEVSKMATVWQILKKSLVQFAFNTLHYKATSKTRKPSFKTLPMTRYIFLPSSKNRVNRGPKIFIYSKTWTNAAILFLTFEFVLIFFDEFSSVIQLMFFILLSFRCCWLLFIR